MTEANQPTSFPHFEQGSPAALYQQIINFCANYTEGFLISLMHQEVEGEDHPFLPLQEKIKSRERTIRHAFQIQVEKLFADFRSIRPTRLHANSSSDWLALGYAGKNASLIQQSIEEVSDHHQQKHSRDLDTLSLRLKSLVHRQDDAHDDLPLSPLNLCNAFYSSIELLSFTSKQTVVIFQQFDRVLDSQLADFYGQLDLSMHELGIMPELTRLELLTQPGYQDDLDDDITNVTIPADATADIDTENVDIDVSNFDIAEDIEQQIEQHLESLKEVTFEGTLKYHEVFKTFLENTDGILAKKQHRDVKKFTRFFTRFLDNPKISDPLKAELSRLSHALMKLVLVDPFFFRSSSHPVNEFIQSIIDFEIRYSKYKPCADWLPDLITGFIRSGHITLDGFDPLIKLFELHKSHRIEEIEIMQKEESKRQEAIKNKVLEIIDEVTQGLVVEDEVVDFFHNEWQLLLLQMAKKMGLQSTAFKQSIEITRVLAWALNQKRRENEKYQQHSFPDILKAVNKGLVAINYPSAHRNSVRKMLISNFKKQHSSRAVFQAAPPKAKKQDELVDQFAETINKHQLDLSSVAQSQAERIDKQLLSFINKLQIGSWVEIRLDHKTRAKRGKLQWKSQDSSLFIFIDQRGHKLCECTLDQVKVYFVEGMITLLSTPGTKFNQRPKLGHSFY